MDNQDITIWQSIQTLAPLIIVGITGGFTVFVIMLAKYWGSVSEKMKIIDSLNSTIRRVDQSLSEIKGNISILDSRLEKTEGAYVQSHSPISLTERGISLVKEINIEDSIANNWDYIKREIKEQNRGKNAYDIQSFLLSTAITDLNKLMDKEGLSKLKKKAYNEGVPLPVLSRVVAITVRDKYFKEEGINHSEVDNYDPTKE